MPSCPRCHSPLPPGFRPTCPACGARYHYRNDAGRSATLRRIIREWDDWRRRTLIDTKADYITATIGE